MLPSKRFERRFDQHRFFAERIDIGKADRAQCKLAFGQTRLGVEHVTDDRMRTGGKVNPDLVRAARDRSGHEQ